MRKIFTPLFLLLVSASVAQKSFTVEDIYKGTFNNPMVYGFVPSIDGKSYYNYDKSSSYILRFDYSSGNVLDTVFDKATLMMDSRDKMPNGFSYVFSKDEQHIILTTDEESIYRHSSKGYVFVYDIKARKIYKVSEKKIMYPDLSPNGKIIAFTEGNNLYIKDLEVVSEPSKMEVPPNPEGAIAREERPIGETAITTDGRANSIINGGVDWVYEEEFSMSKGFFWNHSGNKIAYYKFNEQAVRMFSMEVYNKNLYPEVESFKYPKAGESNSNVEVWVYDLEKKSSEMLRTIHGNNDFYLPRVQWTKDNDIIAVQRLNRLQNELEIIAYDTKSNERKTIYKETNKYYIDITDALTFLDDKKTFIISSEKDGYNHLYQYNMKGDQIAQITIGKYDVDAFLGYDEKSKNVYYTSSEKSPVDRQLYSVNLNGKNKKQLTQKAGWHTVTFNPTFTIFLDNFSDINTPTLQTLYDASGKQLRTLNEVEKINAKFKDYGFVKAEFSTFKTENGTELHYYMIKPAKMEAGKKYPLLMYVYGGPGNQQVVDRWGGANFVWYQHLASLGYVVACVDNRGTGGRGEEFKKSTYLNLGKLETEDQVSAAKYFGTLNFIDKSRIGIWGWSYGGYMSSLCITKGADVFKSAIAVAPVTNWRYYDNIYTERYMRTPQENGQNYDDNSPINHVDKLKGNYLLIHGTADDNVHFQNSVEMVDALISAGKKYDSEYYPNKNHGIGGYATRVHLYKRMTNFILENL